jgi:hypothetical protein
MCCNAVARWLEIQDDGDEMSINQDDDKKIKQDKMMMR